MANEKKNRRNPAKNLADSLPVGVSVFKVFWNIPTKEKWSGGEWKVESGEWRVESGEWRVESGEWKVGSGEWKVESGKWRVGSGEWKVESGEWRVESGKWTFRGEFYHPWGIPLWLTL